MNELYYKSKLEQILKEVDEYESVARDAAKTVELDPGKMGRVSRIDALQSQALNKETNRMRQLKKERAIAALERIKNGEYGRCLKCGQQINRGRLDFDPTSFLCVSCAQ